MTLKIGTERPIDELNRGLEMFFQSVLSDEMARFSAELAIVTFGKNGVQILRDFSLIDTNPTPPKLGANGLTPMAQAVECSLDLMKKRKEQYRAAGVEYFQPWLVLMTDGEPDDKQEAQKVGNQCQQMANEKKLVVFGIGIGDKANMGVLQYFTPHQRRPLKLKGLKFNKFFEWLSASICSVSASTPGDKIKLDLEGLTGWAEL
jgi:uncharacterized protein YegL